MNKNNNDKQTPRRAYKGNTISRKSSGETYWDLIDFWRNLSTIGLNNSALIQQKSIHLLQRQVTICTSIGFLLKPKYSKMMVYVPDKLIFC